MTGASFPLAPDTSAHPRRIALRWEPEVNATAPRALTSSGFGTTSGTDLAATTRLAGETTGTAVSAWHTHPHFLG